MLLTIVDINNGIAELFHLLELFTDLALELLVLLERLVLLAHDLLEALVELYGVVVPAIGHGQVIVNLEDGSACVLNVVCLLVLDGERVIDDLHVQFDGTVTRQLDETLELLAHRILDRHPGLAELLEFVPEDTILV